MGRDLKVLVIAPFYEVFVKGLVDAMARHVEEVNVLVHHNYLSEISRLPLPVPSFSHVRRFTRRNLVNLTNTPENVRVHVESLLYLVPDGRNRRLGGVLSRRYGKLIEEREIEFDIIHAHIEWPYGYAGLKLAEKFGKPLVVTSHSDVQTIERNMKSPLRPAIEEVWRKADAVIRVNRFDMELIRRHNPHVYYIPNGYDPRRLQFMEKDAAREHLGIPLDKRLIFSFSYLYGRKGYQYLIEVMRAIVKEQPETLCIIGGEGPMKKRLQRMVDDYGLEGHVKLIGFIPDEELKYWMNAADIFVLPSLSEGNPTVMFEALGVGLPFIGTNIAGIPDIITSEEYGLLCPPADIECLKEKILIGLRKRWNREKIREYARRFTWDNIARETLQLYERVIR